jgi:hypothetical protein
VLEIHVLLYLLKHKEQNYVHCVVAKGVQNLIKQNAHNKTKYFLKREKRNKYKSQNNLPMNTILRNTGPVPAYQDRCISFSRQFWVLFEELMYVKIERCVGLDLQTEWNQFQHPL